MPEQKPLAGKVVVEGRIVCRTGMHIGALSAELEIGGIDLAVVRDPLTREPYVPGSSLKGKLRSLTERSKGMQYNRQSGKEVSRHECSDPNCLVCRLFGAAGRRNERNQPARAIFRDARLTGESREMLKTIETGLQYTEVKFENGLDRITCAANPRQIERVPAGAEFAFDLVYNVEGQDGETEEDLRTLVEAMRLLEDDYLGGHGSRGSGKVKIGGLRVTVRPVSYYRDSTGEVPFDLDTIDTMAQKVGEIAAAAKGGAPE